MNFKLDAFKSETFDKLVVNSFITPIPSKQEERVEILGKNGTTLISTKYNDRSISIECMLKNTNVRSKLRELLTSLKVDNETLLSLDIDNKTFYIVRFSFLENPEFQNPTLIKFNLGFIGNTEVYKIINNSINVSTINSVANLLALTENVDYTKTIF